MVKWLFGKRRHFHGPKCEARRRIFFGRFRMRFLEYRIDSATNSTRIDSAANDALGKENYYFPTPHFAGRCGIDRFLFLLFRAISPVDLAISRRRPEKRRLGKY